MQYSYSIIPADGLYNNQAPLEKHTGAVIILLIRNNWADIYGILQYELLSVKKYVRIKILEKI